MELYYKTELGIYTDTGAVSNPTSVHCKLIKKSIPVTGCGGL
jgi:hypothetical protein